MSEASETEGIRRINLKVPDELHTRLKLEAVRRRTTLQDMLLAWVEEKLGEAEAKP